MPDDVRGLLERFGRGRKITTCDESVADVVADERATLGSGAVPGARRAPCDLVRTLRERDTLGQAAALDVGPADRVEEAGDEGVVPDLLGDAEAFHECRQSVVVLTLVVLGEPAIPDC